jgi:hypothetical protein
MSTSHGPLDVGQRNHRKRRFVRNRRVFLAVISLVGLVVRLISLVEKIMRHFN